jgi:hypothetical protein
MDGETTFALEVESNDAADRLMALGGKTFRRDSLGKGIVIY